MATPEVIRTERPHEVPKRPVDTDVMYLRDNAEAGKVATAVDEDGRLLLKHTNIRELTDDPASPDDGEVWVRRVGAVVGEPMGILLAITHGGTAATYQLRYKTEDDGIVTLN